MPVFGFQPGITTSPGGVRRRGRRHRRVRRTHSRMHRGSAPAEAGPRWGGRRRRRRHRRNRRVRF